MLLWWAVSIVAGSIWLALYDGREADIVEPAWDLGDGR
jgi:hypothetical protein